MSLKFCCCLLEVGALPSHHDVVTELGLVGAGPLGETRRVRRFIGGGRVPRFS